MSQRDAAARVVVQVSGGGGRSFAVPAPPGGGRSVAAPAPPRAGLTPLGGGAFAFGLALVAGGALWWSRRASPAEKPDAGVTSTRFYRGPANEPEPKPKSENEHEPETVEGAATPTLVPSEDEGGADLELSVGGEKLPLVIEGSEDEPLYVPGGEARGAERTLNIVVVPLVLFEGVIKEIYPHISQSESEGGLVILRTKLSRTAPAHRDQTQYALTLDAGATLGLGGPRRPVVLFPAEGCEGWCAAAVSHALRTAVKSWRLDSARLNFSVYPRLYGSGFEELGEAERAAVLARLRKIAAFEGYRTDRNAA